MVTPPFSTNSPLEAVRARHGLVSVVSAAGLLAGCTLSNTSEGGTDGLDLSNRSQPSERSIQLLLNPGENPLAALAEIELEDSEVLATSNISVGYMMTELGAYFSANTRYQSGAVGAESDQCQGSTLPDVVEVVCGVINPPQGEGDASEGGAEEAASAQFLFIDETPTMAQHRVTGRRLLECAREAGFEYFVIEALEEPAAALAQRGYVSRLESGLFLREPQLAGLVEDALRLGFTPIGLPPGEFCDDCTPVEAFSRNAEPKSDSLIQQTIGIDPAAKVLVWTGPGQSFEQPWGPRPFVNSLAAFVFQKTGVDPYTLTQRTLEPTASLGPTPPSGIHIATGPNNGSCSGSYSPGSATGLSTHDGAIMHIAPPVGGSGSDALRWEWLHAPPENRMSVTAECASCAPGQRLLVQAFPSGVDVADRVPADQALCSAGTACQLALPPGDYQLVVWSDLERLAATQVSLAAGTPTSVSMD